MDNFTAKGKHQGTVADECDFQLTFGGFNYIGLKIASGEPCSFKRYAEQRK
jgi:hypothetical protein